MARSIFTDKRVLEGVIRMPPDERARRGFSDIKDWIIHVPDLSYLFSGRPFNEDISGWDVSQVTNMNKMFEDDTEFNQDISGWDVSSVKYMDDMFSGAIKFDQNLSRWQVQNVVDMKRMFFGASKFNGDISTWEVGNVDTMEFMFHSAVMFDKDISAWDVSKVRTMSGMFLRASSFNQDLTAWGPRLLNVVNMGAMFHGATSFRQSLAGWNVPRVVEFGASNSQLTGLFPLLPTLSRLTVENCQLTTLTIPDDWRGFLECRHNPFNSITLHRLVEFYQNVLAHPPAYAHVHAQGELQYLNAILQQRHRLEQTAASNLGYPTFPVGPLAAATPRVITSSRAPGKVPHELAELIKDFVGGKSRRKHKRKRKTNKMKRFTSTR